MNALEARGFIDSVLRGALPPAHPLKRKDWAGLAFDRNCHEDLAPTSVWLALFSAHVKFNGDLVRLLHTDGEGRDKLESIAPNVEQLRSRLDDGLAFIANFFVFSPNENWLVRLDYDVTLFCGEVPLIKDVVINSGGLDAVRGAMVDDFYGGYERQAWGLDRYIERLLEPLRHMERA